jgi:PAS domain S-box-containing protein
MRKLNDESQSLQIILDMLPVGIRIVRFEDGALVYANQASLEIFNCKTVDDIAGKTAFDFMPEIQPDGRKTVDMAAEMFNSDMATMEFQCFKLTGEVFTAKITSRTIEYQGKPSSLAIIENMTAEKEYQLALERTALKEREANLLKSRFLSNISHEIRTPMNVILGLAEIQLQNEELPPATEDAFNKIYESGDLLLSIVNDILDLSKIEAGKLELTPVVYDIPSLINNTVQLVHLYYENKPIEFVIDVDENTPLELLGDELRIKQLLNNLLSNAFKYTNKGRVEFKVTAEFGQQENGMLVFRISDTGQGMTEQQVNELFDEYSRFNTRISRTATGTGLGMSISKRLVDMMNGEMTVESKPDEGTVFTVRIPQKRLSSKLCGAELVNKLRKLRFHSATIAKKLNIIREYMPYGSVLIVDDLESNIFVAKGMLLPYGLKVDTATSGFEAIEKINDGNVYDIIFMDHMMPEMNGMEAVKIIREMRYTSYIVALTANAVVGQAEKFLANGFDGFISKPIDSRELDYMLNEFIRDKKNHEVVEQARQEKLKRGNRGRLSSTLDVAHNPEVQKFFMLDAAKVVSVLKNINEKLLKREDLLEVSDFESFVIAVHGMKGILINIGEVELSETAYKLEKAGNEHNLVVMAEETSGFLEKLQALIEKIKTTNQNEEEYSATAEISLEEIAYLCEKLYEIKKACFEFNIKSAKRILKELYQKKWTQKINKILDELSVHLLHSAFKNAAALADNSINSLREYNLC